MSEPIQISLSETGNKGRYEAHVPGHEAVGELTYSRMSAKTIIADHTSVPDSLRGMGVGQALVQRLVDDARTHGFEIVPLCPFVRSQYARHPEWADVMQA